MAEEEGLSSSSAECAYIKMIRTEISMSLLIWFSLHAVDPYGANRPRRGHLTVSFSKSSFCGLLTSIMTSLFLPSKLIIVYRTVQCRALSEISKRPAVAGYF